MANYKSSTDDEKGQPNLEALLFLQKHWGPDDISASIQVAKAIVISGGGNIEFSIPVGAEIIDAWVICTRDNSGGTVQISTGADSPVAITDAMICAVDTTVVHAATIDDDYNIVGTDGIIAVQGQDGDAGNVYIKYKK